MAANACSDGRFSDPIWDCVCRVICAEGLASFRWILLLVFELAGLSYYWFCLLWDWAIRWEILFLPGIWSVQ